MPSSHAYSSVNPSRSTFTEEQKKNIILKVSGNTYDVVFLAGEFICSSIVKVPNFGKHPAW